ncbi:hypothetical protein Sgly_0767 [Syntrophobotulus glycolicus DSM 8271]|uniref:Phage terminase large subunit GpA ATPase domain-containing protein n=1 Tax=Syntrophobotulus glycolicus (strain DSM 8271 / FlGlyR) TaxID=645991 RepID=F0T160_SYNGF|nr:phage terminase large subunit family protein [Syntrophobotulus glycolicus]ADY55124.1 hypothetical protein Sgly_0767 [Syntrophobotulus glycolicus DSM 8271]
MNDLEQFAGQFGKSQALSFPEYCLKHIILDDLTPYDVYNRPYMAEIVKTSFKHPNSVVSKGAQTGFSTYYLARAMYMVDVLGANLIYYLPTDKLAIRFGETRFDPYVDRSEYLKSRLMGTDKAGLKQIGTHFFYMLGLHGKGGAISIPADEILFDEVALINRENMDLAQDRILASKLGWQRYFSAPLFEEDGIDELYRQSDMRKWLVKCSGCNHYSIVEEDFPDNILETKDSDKRSIRIICSKCGKPLDVAQGKWVPEHPDKTDETIGYRVPQLIIPDARLDLIWSRWKRAQGKPNKLALVRRSALGIADSGNMQPINSTTLQLVEAAGDYYFQDSSEEACGIGIDMGDAAHVAVLAPYKEDGFRIVAAWHVDVEDLLEMIPHLEETYNVGCLVIDAMPYKTESKRVVRILQTATGYIQYFKQNYKESTEGEEEKQVNVIQVDRDESLDETTELFGCNPPRALLFKPRNIEEENTLEEIRRQLKKLLKEEIIGADSNKRISYKKNVENHFGMAINSGRIALNQMGVHGKKKGPAISGGQVIGRSLASDIHW